MLKKKENNLSALSEGAPGSNLEIAETGSMINVSDGGRKAVVEFTAARSAILEKEQKVRVSVRRYGRLDCAVVCRFEPFIGQFESRDCEDLVILSKVPLRVRCPAIRLNQVLNELNV